MGSRTSSGSARSDTQRRARRITGRNGATIGTLDFELLRHGNFAVYKRTIAPTGGVLNPKSDFFAREEPHNEQQDHAIRGGRTLRWSGSSSDRACPQPSG